MSAARTIRSFGPDIARRRRRRLGAIFGIGALLAVAGALVAVALENQIAYFRTPAQIAAGEVTPGERLRVGGLVKEASVRQGGEQVTFVVTDTAADVTVRYNGILPDLFREGQGIVADGRLGPDGEFVADTVLAKHDENYMPAEVAEALKAQGRWRPDE